MAWLPTDTAADIRSGGNRIAALPVASYEQHGDHLPVTTDTLIACIVAERISVDHGLPLLPPLAFGCTHEHAELGATVSIRARTLYDLVVDLADSLERSGVPGLVVVNGHGGNYVLGNIVQEANERQRRMALFPSRADWDEARRAAEMETMGTEDMHAGELETSILLHAAPSVVRPEYAAADHEATSRPVFATVGMSGYTPTGVIGRPSLSEEAKGAAVLTSLSSSVTRHLAAWIHGRGGSGAGLLLSQRESVGVSSAKVNPSTRLRDLPVPLR